jgi:hypothetical protein
VIAIQTAALAPSSLAPCGCKADSATPAAPIVAVSANWAASPRPAKCSVINTASPRT